MRVPNGVRYLLPSLLCWAALVVGAKAGALPEYMQTAKTTYAFKSGGILELKGCSLCHDGATNRNSLNAYGKDLQSALKSSSGGKVTPSILRSIDGQDSDGDGWTNGAEFAGDTLPGDPASKPNGSPPGSLKPKAPNRSGAEFNPFSVGSLLFPSHSQHPVIVHFPIALGIFSLILDLFGILTKNRALNTAAFYNLAGAAVTGVASVATGLLAWKFAFGGEPLTSDKWLLLHLVLGVVSTLLICALLAIRLRTVRDVDQPLSRLYIVLGVATFAVISLAGHIGGVVSGIVR